MSKMRYVKRFGHMNILTLICYSMATLFPTPPHPHPPKISALDFLHITDKGQVESRPKVVKEKITTIHQWTDAFLIFACIYLNKYLVKMQEINQNCSHETLHYMSIIRKATACSFFLPWRTYDEQFRPRQASNVQSHGPISILTFG